MREESRRWRRRGRPALLEAVLALLDAATASGRLRGRPSALGALGFTCGISYVRNGVIYA